MTNFTLNFNVMKRLFVAVKIHPSAEFLKTYNSLKMGLKFAQITWVKPESIHVTLKFFGETMENRIPDISKVLREAAARHKPFTSELVNVGIFGSSYSPKVIWFGIDKAEPLKKLGIDVLQSVEKIGWEHERQNFVPHITIGRIKFIPDKHLFQSVIDEHKKTWMQEIQVQEFHLYESILRSEGPIYKIVESYKLSAGRE
jgi:RNA 2',3'-cyclic 3'-phosphodiesterase